MVLGSNSHYEKPTKKHLLGGKKEENPFVSTVALSL